MAQLFVIGRIVLAPISTVLSEPHHTVKFHADRFRIAGVICEKPILVYAEASWTIIAISAEAVVKLASACNNVICMLSLG